MERIGDLLRQARKRFRALGMNIRTKHDDGRVGWAEHGPFDAIVVTAAAPALVDALIEQLAEGAGCWRRSVVPGRSRWCSWTARPTAASNNTCWRRSPSCRCCLACSTNPRSRVA